MFTLKSDRKIFLKWWLLAAIIYLLFSIIVTWHYGVNFLMPLDSDTAQHIQLAENLIKYKTFSLDSLDLNKNLSLPLRPTNFLTPAFAWWLAAIYLIFSSFTPAIFLGAIFFALAVPLTNFIGREIFSDKKATTLATIAFLVEPLSIYHSGLVFTEQLFVPFFLVAIYLFIRYLKTMDKRLLVIALFLFSFSTLIRPIIFYLLPLLIIIPIIIELRTSRKKAIIFGLICLFVVYSAVGMWMIRNKLVLNTWQISSNQKAILGYHYQTLRQYLIRNKGFDPGNIDVKSLSFYDVDEYSEIVGKLSIQKILQYKWDYLKIHLYYMPLFFVSNGYDNLSRELLNKPENSNVNFGNRLLLQAFSGNLKGILNSLFSAPIPDVIFVLGAFIWVIISLAALFGFYAAFRSKKGVDKLVIIGIIVLILYFPFVSSPLITARYRLPINPLIFIFAASGLYNIKKIINAHYAKQY